MQPTKGSRKLRANEHEPSETVTDRLYLRSARRQSSGSDDQRQPWTVTSICPSTESEMHQLGNHIVALQFCLRQLGGRQSTEELEGVVRTGLEVCEQGIAAFRKVHGATRVRPLVRVEGTQCR